MIKPLLALLCASAICVALTACAPSHNEGNNGGNKEGQKKCEDCVATDDAGPDQYNPGNSCTSKSACQVNSASLLSDLANRWCHDNNVGKCDGDCGEGNHCDGIYDKTRSKGLTVAAKIDPANSKKCAAPLVTCEAELDIAAGGLLACKCSCNPGK